MSRNSSKPNRPIQRKQAADQIPDFIWRELPSLADEPEYWRARALLLGKYDRDKVSDMAQSTSFSRAQTPEEWNDLASHYPAEPLPPAAMSKPTHEDVPVRAFMLKQAVLALLRLHNAPATMRHDLEQLLDSFLENPAEVRANVQALRLDYPELSWAEVCELAGADYREVMRNKADGAIAYRPDMGPGPSSTP
jgi:hypothetical protein